VKQAIPFLLLFLLGGCAAAEARRGSPKRPMLIWDRAPHSAFTDLVRFGDRFLCAFREAPGHVPRSTGEDGVVRILESADGKRWESLAVLEAEGIDLRDPKFATLPDGRLLVVMGGSIYEEGQCVGRVPRVAFGRLTAQGIVFGPPLEAVVDPAIRGPRDWLWNVEWHGEHGYGFLYQPVPEPDWALHLVRTGDGVQYESVVRLEIDGRPSEAALGFEPDGRLVAVVRRDGEDRLGWIGSSAAPYTDWDWKPMDVRVGGPALLRLAQDEWLLGTREYGEGGTTRTVLGRVGLDGHFERTVTLQSGGDTSYPGLVRDGDDVLVSYYSSHGERTAIYAARVPLAR
jgi:hypothetical protein